MLWTHLSEHFGYIKGTFKRVSTPIVPMKETRQEEVKVYLTSEEKRKIRKQAAEQDMQMSEYMRQQSLQTQKVKA